MLDAEEGSLESVTPENGGGVILGYWDHEKTPALIQDLERSVCLVEDKCKQLLEELIYYKRCGEESMELDRHLVRFESKSNIAKETSCSLYGSEPDIVHRQSLINFQELQQVFEERFEQKLSGINKELTEVSRKIGLKNNVVLFPTNDYLKALNAQIEKEAQKSWRNNRDKFFKSCFLTANAKSDSLIQQHGGGEGEFSKITKNELALYQKLSSMSKRRTRSKKRRGKAPASRGEKVKLGGKWKSLKLRQDLLPGKRKRKKSGKKIYKKREKRKAVLRTASCSSRNSRSSPLSLGKLSDEEIEKICKLLRETIGKKKLRKSRQQGRRRALRDPKKSPAFTSYSAPLRSSEDDVGQLHQLEQNSELRISTSENIQGRTKKQVLSKSTTLVNKGRPILRSSSEIKNDVSKRRRNGHAKRKRKVWTAEKHSSQNAKRPQVKCTISLPRGFFEDTKSLSNFESKSSKKSRARRASTVDSNVRTPECQSTNFWGGCKMERYIEDASGDGSCNDRFAKWAKAHPSLLNIKSKYNSLKGTQRNRNLAFIDEELKCLEKDIVCSLDKYRKFLRFYSTFIHKNRRVKPLKIDCEATKYRTSKRRKSWDLNPIYISAMKKTFREIEALQRKIKLWREV